MFMVRRSQNPFCIDYRLINCNTIYVTLYSKQIVNLETQHYALKTLYKKKSSKPKFVCIAFEKIKSDKTT